MQKHSLKAPGIERDKSRRTKSYRDDAPCPTSRNAFIVAAKMIIRTILNKSNTKKTGMENFFALHPGFPV
ncbi:hypothetical protein CSR02_00800 [Acetobacter pomorum]|uniref:Uncharacterized protein n=1 Tax=Acetobacter pomorum TaxID=65959 RepID=A0A2G4RG42_9PROT|nr:hypothetical protein [Acetobacter pomorum]PHY95518.1 hypothetical protein CSR02_00800 [Acetobacter pomorum]